MEMIRESYCEATVSLTLMEANAIASGQYKMKISNPCNEAYSETALIVRRKFHAVIRFQLKDEEKKVFSFCLKFLLDSRHEKF